MVINTKKMVLIYLLCQCFNVLIGQEKYSNTWILFSTDDSLNKIEWNLSNPTFSLIKRKKIYFGNIASICDIAGKIKYVSGGCSILDKDLNYLSSAKDINAGYIYETYCSNGVFSYPTWNGLIFLPMPSDTTKYVLFHESMEEDSLQFYPPRKLNYSIVDATLNNGIGDVTKKNESILYNRLSKVGIQACRHGNGRDWWVIAPQMGFQGYYTTLLSPKGVGAPQYQKMNNDSLLEYDFAGQSVFSPDGTTYIRADPANGVYAMNFDRCTGKLSNLITLKDTLNGTRTGVAISPNSRYLYVTRRYWLLQYDLQANDIQASQTVIDTFDGFQAPSSTTFYQCLLAPDGKIYMGATNGGDVLHIIHNPDAAGKACDFRQHDIIFKKQIDELPNLPNFKLGAKKGSPCEKELSNQEEPWEANKIMLFPNPSNDLLNISLTWKFQHLFITDITGRQLKKIVTNDYESDYQISTLDLENGFYFIQGIREDGKTVVQRFVVQH
jgi:Secretion system C-terminal sorting domain